MKKEVNNHIKHVQLTFERLLYMLFSEKEWQELTEQEDGFAERISSHRSWIKTSELALDGIITERMALILFTVRYH